MKNVFNFIFSLLALALIIFNVILLIPTIDTTELLLNSIVASIMLYGPIFLLSGFALINFSERSFKILFLIITVFAVAALVLGLFFPELLNF